MSAAILIRAAAWLAVIVTSVSHARADTWTGLRTSLACCGDVNHDGLPDFLVANRDLVNAPAVWLLSGKDGSVLHVFRGSVKGDGFGEYVAATGDLDGDGLPEIVISSSGHHCESQGSQSPDDVTPLRREERGKSECRVFSSRSFETLLGWPNRGSVTLLHDRDGDGVPDLALVSQPDEREAPATVRICTGHDGATLVEFPPRKPGRFLQGAAVVLGDLDGDGLEDLAVGFALERSENERSTGAIACSGKDGHELWRYIRPLDNDEPSVILARIGDIDRDAVADLLVAQQSRWLRAVSGKGKGWLFRNGTKYASDIDAFASSLDIVADVTGDGFADFVVGANEQTGRGLFDEGYVWLCSGKSGVQQKELFSSRDEGADVCALGDVDGDGDPDVVLHLLPEDTLHTKECNPSIRVVSTKDGRTIWEKDTRTLRMAVGNPTAKPESKQTR